MDNNRQFPFNSFDRILFVIISSFLINGFLLWLLGNLIHLNDLFIWFLTIPVSLYISYFTSKSFHFHTDRINFKPYLLLFGLLAISAVYLLQPIISNPYATIGIPNKDLHDGIASYISLHGSAPTDKITSDTAFIPSSQNGFYLGYPNGLHEMAGFLDKLGFSEFHSTWIVITLALLITSLAVFLISKAILNNPYYSAVIGGLFALSSFRIAYAVVASIPMLFSYTLVIPVLLICLFAIHNKKGKFFYIVPSISIAFLAASYSGTIVLVGGFLALYAVLLLLTKDGERLENLGKLVLYSLPFLGLAFLLQHPIYWENTFPTAKDYDPTELSQKVPPVDRPIYMIIYCLSLVVSLFYLLKNRFKNMNLIKTFLLLVNLGFLFFIPYYLLFHSINHISSSEQLVNVARDGLFGELNYQKMSRLALLQPFFFIFFLGEFSLLIKNTALKVLALLLVIALCFVIRFDIPLYQWSAPEIASSFYNPTSMNKPYTLLSDTRLVLNDQIWSKEIIDGLNYLRLQENQNDKVLIWDNRNWTEETISGWGSVLLKYKLLERKDLNIDSLNEQNPSVVLNRGLKYILLLYPTPKLLQNFNSTTNLKLVWQENNTYIFKIGD